MSKPDRPRRRMLLVASIGVATISYVAACEPHPSAGNLAQPERTIDVPPMDAGATPSAPVATDAPDAGDGDASDMSSVKAWMTPSPTAGNLMAHAPDPPPSATASGRHKPKSVPWSPPTTGNQPHPPFKP